MREAIVTTRRGIAAWQTPFGAAIMQGGRFIAAAHNQVRATCDPSAHAEVNALREACRVLSTIDLSGCVMATPCEPGPMCAAAIHWSRISEVHFGADIADAAAASFNELTVPAETLYQLGGSRVRIVRGLLQRECAALFDEWRQGPNPVPY